MTRSAPASDAGPRSRPAIAGLLLALAAAGATIALWVILASITGLIYHFLPGAPFLVAAWVFRQVKHGRHAAWSEISVIVTVGAAASVLGSLAVASIGRELDAPAATGLVALAGAAMSAAWLRRGPSAVAADRRSDVPNP